MRKIIGILIMTLLIAIMLPSTSSNSNEYISVDFKENENIRSCDISWNKHIIDDAFDYAFGVHAVDVDNDGDCDVLGAAEQGDYIAWWRNEGGNPITWTKFLIDDNFDGATSVYAVDIDDDRDVDVVGSAGTADEIALWINDGENPIAWTKMVIRSDFDFAHEVYCYDLDEDDDIDILGSSSDGHQIAWWRNDGGAPITWTEQIISTTFYGAKCARVADLDNDSFLDIVGAAFYADKITWWRNCGGEPIVWEEYVIASNLDGAHRTEVCDIDFDGDIDIIVSAYFEQEISLWRNDGGMPITWTKQVITSEFNGACIGLPIDMDNDGDIDVVGTAQQDYEVALFQNEGGSPVEWTKIIIDSNYKGAWPGVVADIDDDGDTDIVAGASFGNKLAWWENDLTEQPLKPDRPTGIISGKPGKKYSYSSKTTDPFNLELSYQFDWGDGNVSEWIGPYPSGDECSTTHTWQTSGNYNIKVKAKNSNGSESVWSDPLEISMPKSKPYINTPLLNFLEDHPYMFPLLRQLLRL